MARKKEKSLRELERDLLKTVFVFSINYLTEIIDQPPITRKIPAPRKGRGNDYIEFEEVK